MQITLKRADFYARAALKAATDIKYEPTVEFSIYDPATAFVTSPGEVTAEIDQARSKLLALHQLSLDLIRANYTIRALLAEANMKTGISQRLNDNARLATEETRARLLIKAMEGVGRVERSPEAVLTKAKALREQPGERYLGRDTTVETSGFYPADLDGVRKHLKLIMDERGGLNDALTALNVTNTVTLDRDTVSTLQKADILPT